MIDVSKALFLLARHGQTLKNIEDEFRGWSNDESAELDKVGIKQAKTAGRFLSKLPINIGIIFTSDLNRAVHTAAIIASILGIKHIHQDERLRCLNVGDFTGKEKEGTDIDSYLENPDEPFPGGESVDNFRNRQQSFSDELFNWIAAHPKEKALVVGHLSNVVYWEDLNLALSGYLKNYSTVKEDLIRPGGIVAIMPDEKVIPILGANRKPDISDEGGE